jgi:hypothetical protein
MKLCRKHRWRKVRVDHRVQWKTDPGEINAMYGAMDIEMCGWCYKLRGRAELLDKICPKTGAVLLA